MIPPDPLRLVDELRCGGVPVVIVGGHAVNFHGYVRATEDVDLVFQRGIGVEDKLLRVLQDWGAYWISDDIDPATGLERTVPVSLDYLRCHRLMMLGTHAGYVDLFDFVPGLPEATVDELFDTAVASGERLFVDLTWLKRMKRAAGRPQDLIDLNCLP